MTELTALSIPMLPRLWQPVISHLGKSTTTISAAEKSQAVIVEAHF